MDAIEQFAEEAARFERWLITGQDRDADAAREALVRLVSLYRAAIDLPTEWSDELDGAKEIKRVDNAAWQVAYRAALRIPLDLYGEVFNPVETPHHEGVTASLADDLADIYWDVVTGLRAYERGERAQAIWEWSFNLHSHWGAHATGAIRALHWWLVENAPDRLHPSGDKAG
jgi:hypothetical protein